MSSQPPRDSVEYAQWFAQSLFDRQRRNNAQQLAQKTFGRKERIKAAIASRRAQGLPIPGEGPSILGKRVHEDDPDGVVEKRKKVKTQLKRIQQERRAARRKARPKGDPKARCHDWMLHSGDVHYARNSSSFDTYTKIDLEATSLLGIGEGVRAIGIGTVRLVARRALDCGNVCVVTLHDVLHIREMPCNGIAQQKIQAAGLKVAFGGRWGLEIWEPTGAPLFCGMEDNRLFRIALRGDPQGERPLEELKNRFTVSILANDHERLAELGIFSRGIHKVEQRIGYRLLEHDCEVEC